jgi:hypothetical protein
MINIKNLSKKFLSMQQISQNIFLNHQELSFNDVNFFSDKQLLEQLKEAVRHGWNMETLYGDQYSYFNVLHVCGFHHYIHSYLWLLEQGMQPNSISGNGNTPFTFFLHSFYKIKQKNISIDEILEFFQKIQKKNTNFSLPGLDNLTPIEIYLKYNIVEPKIFDFLILHLSSKNTDFWNNMIYDQNLFTISSLKKIFKNHTHEYKNLQNSSYYDHLFGVIKGNYGKQKFECLIWLMNYLKISMNERYSIEYFSSVKNFNYHLQLNLFGLAVKNQNKILFHWLLKQNENQKNSSFIIDNKEYSLLEFSIAFNFITGIQFALRNMSTEEFFKIQIEKIINTPTIHGEAISPENLNTLNKTYISLMHKHLQKQIPHQNHKILNKI